MGKRGPPPTPTPVLKARGSWRAKDRAGEVGYPAGAPPLPAVLCGPARAEWQRVVGELQAAGVLQRTDLAALAGYCEAWGEFCRLTRLVERAVKAAERVKEPVPLGETDFKLMRLKNAAAERAAKMAQQFGFTPASRPRVQAGDPQTADTASGAELKMKFFGGGA